MTALPLKETAQVLVAAPPRTTRPRPYAVCTRELGGLPCLNRSPHAGGGRGCVHHSGSGVPDRHDLGDEE
jgi:hypothetical protein